MEDREVIIAKIDEYIDWLAEPNEAFPICPFVKKERASGKLKYELFEANKTSSIFNIIGSWDMEDDYDSMIIAHLSDITLREHKIFQHYINRGLRKRKMGYIKVICFHPDDTFEVGEVDPETKKLLDVTKQSLYEGIRELKAGNRVGDVGYAIQHYAEKHGYGVVRELVGHGLGRVMHEDPEMPNYGKRGRGKKFVNGMVVAIEPMINMGTHKINQLKDGWTILTRDGKPSAHFEHDVAIVDGKPEILSTFNYIYDALGITSDEEKEFRQKEFIL